MKYIYTLLLLTLLSISACSQDTQIKQAVTLDAINTLYPTNNITTAGQPSAADIERLKQAGFTTVINLRTKGEPLGFDEQAAVEFQGMSYVHLPVAGGAGINKANADKLDQLLNTTKGPVFLHCGSGNRVGALMALRAFHHQNQSAEQALALGKAAGLTRLEPLVKQQLVK